MALILPNQSVALQAYAVLVAQEPGYTALNDHLAYIAAKGVPAYTLALDSIFASTSTTTLATTMLANLGLTGIVSLADAVAYLNSNSSNRVGAMINLSNVLYNYAGTDASILAAQTAYKTSIDTSYAYSIVTTNTASVSLTPSAGTIYNLSAGAQQTGTSGNDTFNGTEATLKLDVLDGAGGIDTLNYNDATATAGAAHNINSLGLSIANIEILNVRSVSDAAVTTTGFTGLTDVNVLIGADTAVTAGTTTNVSVAGVTGTITVDGGQNIVVTDSTAAKAIAIGATTGATGNITVTDTNVGAAAVAVDGGKDVTLTLTGSSASTIKVGADGTPIAPTGVVTITSANKAVAASTDETLSAITVVGGTSVNVTQTATSTFAAADATGATVTQGDVTVTGSTATTSVSVTQAKSTAEVLAKTAVAGTTESASVKFGVLKSGDKLIIGGDGDAVLEAGELQFTAAKDLTAAEVAQAFANLLNPGTQASGPASNGTYQISGTTPITTWTSATASGDTLVVTSTTATTAGVTPLAFGLVNTSTNSVAPILTATTGVTKVAAKTGVLGVINGTVVIDDNATAASITTVTVDGYGNASTIGATNTLSKLANLTLANSGSTGTAGETDATMSVNAAGVASLNLSVNAIKGAVTLDGAGDGALKTLNLTATGANSTFALTAAAVKTLAIAGDKAANLTSSVFTALETVTVSGSAGATLDSGVADTLTSVNTSATTGTVAATIRGNLATYTGGAGVDVVTLDTATALTKAINLGAGDDTLSFAALNVTGSTAAVAGGDGVDTLSMATATAAALDGALQTFYTGFERLTINDADASAAIDLANLGFTNYVTTTGSTGTLTLNNMASNGTLVITTAPTTGYTVGVKDAATGTDVLNVSLNSTGNLAAGVLTVANVETINIATVDTETTSPQTKNVDSLTLTADSATTVKLSGAADLTLTLTGSTKVTTIDALDMTGGLTVTSLNITSATTIKGGSGNDVLTAATGSTADILLGGTGSDTLEANAGLDTLTGGDGRDTFVINVASVNSSSYATITDFKAGDTLQMGSADSFAAAKIVLADTAVFQDYVNTAIKNSGANDVTWFQFGGNTYVVENNSTSTSFVNGTDFIVKLTGTVDLTSASFDSTIGTIAL